MLRLFEIIYVFAISLLCNRDKNIGERLRLALERLGLVFVKIGQVLAARQFFSGDAQAALVRATEEGAVLTVAVAPEGSEPDRMIVGPSTTSVLAGPVGPVGPIGPVAPIGPIAPAAPVLPVFPFLPFVKAISRGSCVLKMKLVWNDSCICRMSVMIAVPV